MMRTLFELDPRSLGFYRIALGGTLVAMAVQKAWFARAFFTADGVVPETAASRLSSFAGSGLFAVDGSHAWALVVIGMLAMAGLAVAFGRSIKLALVVAWVVLRSLSIRNPYIEQIADQLICLWVLWSLFMPLDRAFVWGRPPTDPQPIRAAIGVVWPLQLFPIYLIAGSFKLSSSSWIQGTTMVEAMHIAPVATSIGRALQPATGLLTALTLLTLPLELFLWSLAWSPWRTGPVRTTIAFIFMGFHILGIGLLMHLGLVPIVLAIAWLPLLPPWFWDVALPRLRGQHRRPVARAAIGTSRWKNILLVCIFAFTWASDPGHFLRANDHTFLPQMWNRAVHALHMKQSKYDLWTRPAGSRNYIVAATLADGTQWDLFADQPLDWTNPRRRPYDNQWYKLLQQVPRRPWLQRTLATWFVKEWNAQNEPEKQVVAVDLAILQAKRKPPAWWRSRTDPLVAPKQRVKRWRMTVDAVQDDTRVILSLPVLVKGDPRMPETDGK
ncbi:MAG TPA: hypothetical protein DFR83_04240 [Deltaproteobacteria bacterium]|nr:hypothetical protein [Deltaproteobacteria bacterium]